MPGKSKKFYITTSIPYTNAAPHIGFGLEAIQADVLARYYRGTGIDVFFLTGTDEHGQKTLKAAQAAGKDPLDFANEVSEKFRKLTKVLNISNDDFIRTTDKEKHLPAVYKLWQKYEESGDIYKKKYKGFYCVGCEAFKTQKELVDGKCTIHQKETEVIEEENYFFRLSKYLPKIKELIEKNKFTIIPESKKNEILSMISQGFEDISFSRAKEKYWSWPVPGDDTQSFYVWQDALPNYISGIGYATDEKKFKKYWPADVHCIGKDIIKFHCVYWPAMLLSAGIKLPEAVFVHGFINVDGQKMSKSLGNVVDPFALVEKYGQDAVRYYLLREILPTEDGDFTYQKFEARYNADLAGGLGNLVARVFGIAGKIPNFKFSSFNKCSNAKLKKILAVTEKDLKLQILNFKFNEALALIWEVIAFCDRYVNEEKLWESKDEKVINNLFFAIKKIAGFLSPFLPETAEKINTSLKTGKTEALFPRIS